MSAPLRILSLGAGVQSSTVLLMSCVGELPKLDYAIFADTGWEPKAVYEYLEWLEEYSTYAEIPLLRVSGGDIRSDSLKATVRGRKSDGETAASLPYHSPKEGGGVALLPRQCTSNYKVYPIEKAIRGLLGLKYRSPWPKTPAVELWFGISAEEQRRVRLPDAAWKTHRYPLIFDLHKPFRRHDCLKWFQECDFPPPPRSACLGCPFHSNDEWRAVKADPKAWADVTEFDAAIRTRGGMRGELFLHRSAQPLVQIDFSTAEERGQTALSFREECQGYCGT